MLIMIKIYKNVKAIRFYTNELPCDKTNKVSVRPAKTRISLGIQSDQSVLCPHEESLDY